MHNSVTPGIFRSAHTLRTHMEDKHTICPGYRYGILSSLYKYHNRFIGIDEYFKQLTRLLLKDLFASRRERDHLTLLSKLSFLKLTVAF